MDPIVATPISESSNITDLVVTNGNGVKGLSEMGLKTLPKQYIQPWKPPIVELAKSPHCKFEFLSPISLYFILLSHLQTRNPYNLSTFFLSISDQFAMDSDGFVMDFDGLAMDLWVSVLIKTEMGFQFLILGNKQTTTTNRKSMNIRDEFGKKGFTFRSSIWAV